MNYMRVISKYVHSAAYRVHVVLPQQGLKEVNTQHHANHAYIPPVSCIKVNFFSNLTPQGRTRRFHSTFPPLWLTVELAVDSVQIKNLQFFGLEVTLLHLPLTVVQHSHYCIFSRRFKLPFFSAWNYSVVTHCSGSSIKEWMKLAMLHAGAERPLGGALPWKTLYMRGRGAVHAAWVTPGSCDLRVTGLNAKVTMWIIAC